MWKHLTSLVYEIWMGLTSMTNEKSKIQELKPFSFTRLSTNEIAYTTKIVRWKLDWSHALRVRWSQLTRWKYGPTWDQAGSGIVYLVKNLLKLQMANITAQVGNWPLCRCPSHDQESPIPNIFSQRQHPRSFQERSKSLEWVHSFNTKNATTLHESS